MRTQALVFGVLAAMGTTASAELAATFAFSELNSSFSLESGHFMAVSDTANGLATTGDVTGYSAGFGTAVFEPGFFGNGSFASVLIEMDIVSVSGNTAQAANGRFIIRDADGENVAGSFTGEWTQRFGGVFFDGEISLAQFNGPGDTFDGPGGGSFEMPLDDLNGFLSILSFQSSDLFSESFENRPASADGFLFTVPAPGATALFAAGGLLATSRRRRA